MLVPVIGLVQVGYQARADRYTYVPLVGVFVAATWAASDLLLRTGVPRLRPVLAVVVVIACGVTAYAQVKCWADGVTLWQQTVRATTNNPRAYCNYGQALLKARRPQDALAQYDECLRLSPDNALAMEGRGHVLRHQGKFEQAAEAYKAALAQSDRLPFAHFYLGQILLEQEKLEAAAEQFLANIRNDTDVMRSWAALSRVRQKQGRLDDAKACLRSAGLADD